MRWFFHATALSSLIQLFQPAGSAAIPRDGECRKTKVAILGAGVAGITAAQALSNASMTDFLIVERNDYIGGRVRHTQFGVNPETKAPYTVELGANWVQGLGSEGGPENPIWTLAKRYGLNNTYSNESSILTYDEKGYNDYTGVLADFEKVYSVVEQDAGYILTDNLQDTSFRAGLSTGGWKPKKDMKMQAAEWWAWDLETAQTPEDSGFLYGITGYNLTFYQFSEENNYVWDQRGYNAFVVGESQTFLGANDTRLMLNTTVESLAYSDQGVVVKTHNGCIQADYAISTFSVGVLQNDAITFDPPLPRWKREAIDQFQMGTYTKIFYQFNETFWDPNTQYFLYADPKVRGYYPVWQSLTGPGFLEGSNIIFVTVVENEAYRVEQQPDETTKDEGLAVLRLMFPDKKVPEPVAFCYPRWSFEEMAFGSYSNWPVGMTLEKHQNLRANVGRLYFAGEAMSAQYYGFLQDSGAGMTRYEVLHGTTTLNEYSPANGWLASSFLAYGLGGKPEPDVSRGHARLI
ncbi:N1-acetylpolyamine oxidase [Apiospora saccharicola]|uniref:Amine oxidase n=1 Tax=Apiospora saccharicola TaxID=335842 RepID=A0ABR1WFW8_9PEZI